LSQTTDPKGAGGPAAPEQDQEKRPYVGPHIEQIGTLVSDTEGSGARAADADTSISTPTAR